MNDPNQMSIFLNYMPGMVVYSTHRECPAKDATIGPAIHNPPQKSWQSTTFCHVSGENMDKHKAVFLIVLHPDFRRFFWVVGLVDALSSIKKIQP